MKAILAIFSLTALTILPGCTVLDENDGELEPVRTTSTTTVRKVQTPVNDATWETRTVSRY